MGVVRVYLSLGANEGDREAALREAYRRLCMVLAGPRLSRLYETEPMYVLDQPRFLNAACSGWSSLAPLELLAETHRIEQELGRVRGLPKGPRAIDVDILLHGEVAFSSDRLTLPHPLMRERAFVLVPLLELSPDLREPLTARPYRDYLDTLGTTGVSLYARAGDA